MSKIIKLHKIKYYDKDLDQIKDRALTEYKQLSGQYAMTRAYITAVCVWLKEKGVLKDEDTPEYQARILTILFSTDD